MQPTQRQVQPARQAIAAGSTMSWKGTSMFRKRTVLLAGLMAAALALTACGRSSDTGSAAESSAPAATISSGPATGNLTMWAQGAEAEKLPELLKEFTAANPGV